MTESNQIINTFTNHLKRSGKSESTRIAYQKDLEQLSDTNTKKSLTEFTEDDIKKGLAFLKRQKDLSAKTVSRKLNSIRAFYTYLVTTKKIVYNPALDIPHPKFTPKKKRILRPTEYLALKEVSRENLRLYTMIEMLLQTGIRISELSRLSISDVHFSQKPYVYIKPYESNDERKVELNKKIVSVLKTYLSTKPKKTPKAPLFETRNGNYMEVRNIRSSIDRAIIKAKLRDVCVNDLRNTFIAYQLSNGVSISKVAELVGHKNEITTQKYLRLLNKKYKASGNDSVVEL